MQIGMFKHERCEEPKSHPERHRDAKRKQEDPNSMENRCQEYFSAMKATQCSVDALGTCFLFTERT